MRRNVVFFVAFFDEPLQNGSSLEYQKGTRRSVSSFATPPLRAVVGLPSGPVTGLGEPLRQQRGTFGMLGRSFHVLLFHAALCVPAHAGQPGPAQPLPTHAVHAIRGIIYDQTSNARDVARHRLDVYRPTGKGPFPVLVFVHGGAWMFMSKDDVLGIYGYGTIARDLAARGLVVVLPNYRLSPGVRHPEHIKDVAQAFAWTCRNIAEFGGDPQRIFVGGHSAGGHLAALLATDETYLKGVGCTLGDIRGVVALSGVFRLDEFEVQLPLSGRVIRPLRLVFGGDPEIARLASPLTHVRRGLPPFLVMTGGRD